MDKLNSQKVFDLEYYFEIAPDLLCIAGFDGYFKKINPAVSKTLGYTQVELLSAPINSFVHLDDQLLTSKKRSELIEGHSLLNFENRYLTKAGSIVWLSWTSVPIMRDNVVFAIAKNVTYRKQLEEYDRISSILEMINDDHHKRFRKQPRPPVAGGQSMSSVEDTGVQGYVPTQSDQLWLNSFEMVVRDNVSNADLNLDLISDGLALSQRQLFRRVDRILGITPNKLVRIIRLQLAWEAIATGKYRTVKEVSHISGYNSRSHFSRLFREVYGINVTDLL
ncbi:MAG TPA: helix-turn-helix domain-containing protein [Pedobacter sp.]|nr:helix-turn-helix domain-containing protein [Pedobacter sp.]